MTQLMRDRRLYLILDLDLTVLHAAMEYAVSEDEIKQHKEVILI